MTSAADMMSVLADAIARLNASHRDTLGRIASVCDEVSTLTSRVSERRDARELADFDKLAQRALTLTRARRFGELLPRELKVAARSVLALKPDEMALLLDARKEAWPIFVQQALRIWDALSELADGEGMLRLLSNAPSMPGLMNAEAFPRTWLRAADPAAAIEERLPVEPVVALVDRLSRLAVPVRGDFAARVLTKRLLRNHPMSEPSRAVVDELRGVPEVAAIVLPAPQAGNGLVAGLKYRSGAPVAKAMLVASLLRRLESEQDGQIVEVLLDSTMGDPRLLPLSEGWRRVHEQDPSAFDKFVGALTRDDLKLFFQHAMREPDRERFWLRYVGAIRRTLCVVDKGSARALEDRLRASEAGLRASLKRVKRLTSSDSVSAFCLYFDRYVVVEFSSTGNAAYVYARDVFERELEPSLTAGRLARAADLKKKSLRVHRITHLSGWESSAASELAGLHILPVSVPQQARALRLVPPPAPLSVGPARTIVGGQPVLAPPPPPRQSAPPSAPDQLVSALVMRELPGFMKKLEWAAGCEGRHWHQNGLCPICHSPAREGMQAHASGCVLDSMLNALGAPFAIRASLRQRREPSSVRELLAACEWRGCDRSPSSAGFCPYCRLGRPTHAIGCPMLRATRGELR